MPEIIGQQIPIQETPPIFPINISEKEIKQLPDYQEAPAFYRGLLVKDAFKSLFSQLELKSNPKQDIIKDRDNATINDRDAIAYAPSSVNKNNKRFLCAIGFNPVGGIEILPSRLNNPNQFRVNGKVRASEIIIRPAGKKPGQPGKTKFLSPKEFFYWYRENIDLEK